MAHKSDSKKPADGPIDAEVVRELAEIIAATGLTEIEVERGDLRVRVARELIAAPQAVAATIPAVAAPAAPAAPVAAAAAPAAAEDVADHPGTVPSPMVGTAYLSPDPDSPPFITVGQTVEEGATLLLIEAMKTFNPITAPRSGKILRIVVEDAEPVEFGQPLVVLG